MKRIRFILKKLVRSLPLSTVLKEKVLFRLKVGYWPNFSQPKTFSEKLHYRKFHEKDERLVSLSDKLKVRDFVEARVGGEYLIPLVYKGMGIDVEQLVGLGDDIVVKRNNDSGSVFPIKENTRVKATSVCSSISHEIDYGKSTNEWWYREIPSRILVERLLNEPGEYRPIDYKFFVFEDYFFVEAIRRKAGGEIECGFFDENLGALEFKGQAIEYKGCLPFTGPFPAKDTFDEMISVARKLSDGLSFLRVDLYSVNNKVYFGELTFCPSEGRVCLSPVGFDRMLGSRWLSPLLLSARSEMSDLEISVCNN